MLILLVALILFFLVGRSFLSATVEVAGFVIAIIVFLFLKMRKKTHIISNVPQKSSSIDAPVAPVTPVAPDGIPDNKTITVPAEIDGNSISYHYDDVVLVDPTEYIHHVSEGSTLSFEDDGTRIRVMVGAIHIGYLPDNRLSGMVRDWKRDAKPIFSFLSDASASNPIIFLAFYDNVLGNFLSRNPKARKFKLTGKPEEYAFYTVGQKCDIEKNDETDKYDVLIDGSRIGTLPASAITFASTIAADPEMLDAVIVSVDYDIEKDRDIISVYLA